MRCDQIFVDAPGDERLEHGPGSRPPEGVKASLRQIGDAWRKIEAEQIRQSEGVIADAAAISVVGRDTQIGLVVEQAVNDKGGLSGRGVSRWCGMAPGGPKGAYKKARRQCARNEH